MNAVPWSHPGFAEIAELLAARAGLAFSPSRRGTTESRIARAMTRAGVGDLDDYCRRLRDGNGLLDDLIAEITITESYFFRDANQFEVLRRVILPALRRIRKPDHRFRVWSAGCAAGQEAYSLAILFEEEGLGDRVNILATDISRDSLKQGAAATYTDWSLRNNGEAVVSRYFRRHGKRFELAGRLKQRVTFQYHNLALDRYPQLASGIWGMDLILCRNVLIYFDRPTIQRVGGHLLACLAEGGWLMTGASDPPIAVEPPFATVATRAGTVFRHGAIDAKRRAVAPVPSRSDITVVDPAIAARPAPPEPARIAAAVAGTIARVARARRPDETPGVRVTPIEAARDALARGDYAQAVELAAQIGDATEARALLVRALSNRGDLAAAVRAADEAVARHPLTPELHFLRAAVLAERGRFDDAAQALGRVLYLDPTLGAAHLALGAALWRGGDPAGGRRAYRKAQALFAGRPTDEIAPLAEGEQAGRLAQAAAAHVALLDAYREGEA